MRIIVFQRSDGSDLRGHRARLSEDGRITLLSQRRLPSQVRSQSARQVVLARFHFSGKGSVYRALAKRDRIYL